jgi:ketosteroid isomerase-like protein
MDGDAQSVRDALTALDDAFERRDLDAVLALCTEDVVFIGSGEGEEGSVATQSARCSLPLRRTSTVDSNGP